MTPIEQKLEGIARESNSRDKGTCYMGASENCDICETPIAQSRFFIDASLKENPMMWGCLCTQCFEEEGSGLGIGKGQLYEKQDNGDWLLVAGD